MSIRQSGGFIEKEELGIASRRHHGAMPPTKLQPTRDPATDLPVADNLTPRVMQNAAVAHQRSPSRYGDDLAKRRNPVSQWCGCCHPASLMRWMNERHLQMCASAEWAETVRTEILPWAVQGRDLGDDVLEI